MNSFATLPVVQSFLVREKRKVLVPASTVDSAHLPSNLVAAVVADIGSLGFTLDGDVVSALRGLQAGALTEFHLQLVEVLRNAVGANVRYRPLFKNFPHDVPDSREYLVKRLIGYVESAVGPLTRANYTALSCGHLVNSHLFDLEKFGACPICQHQVPELGGPQANTVPLNELTPLKVLGLAVDADVYAAVDNMARARTSLSESYKGFLTAVIEVQAAEVARRLPAVMPFKENATFVTAALLLQGVDGADLLRFLKTPTDVLRLAVALCGGDVSLKEVTKFKLANGHRQLLMTALNALTQKDEVLHEEMLGYRGRWLRLGEVLHIGQFQRRFPKAWLAFDTLRNREATITTYGYRVEALLQDSGLLQASVRQDLLMAMAARPGEMARKLDALLQRDLPASEVLAVFSDVVAKVSTTILLTLLAHFRQRAAVAPFRAFMPKGSVAKMYVTEGDNRKVIPLSARLAVLELVDAELQRRFAERKALGKVFVDDALEAVLVPFSQRSASSGMSPLTRGSRIAYDASKGFVRLFMHWAEAPGTGTIDVDLSCGLYDANWRGVDHLSWTNAKSCGKSAHSGDVRSGSNPEGACEFIDLDLDALRAAGVRYAAVMVFSWTGQSFDKFPCFAGFMERGVPTRGEQFEAKTVKHKFAVSGALVTMVPMVLDVETNEVLWADLSLTSKGRCNSVESVGPRAIAQMKAVDAMQHQRLSLKELFELHARARGTLVATREDADLVLDESQVNKLDEVVADWL